jgi:hypothetical protein
MKMHLGLRVAQCQLSSWYGVLGELLAIAGAPGVVRSGVAAVLAEGICLLFVSWMLLLGLFVLVFLTQIEYCAAGLAGAAGLACFSLLSAELFVV